jgi:hypothetical protein
MGISPEENIAYLEAVLAKARLGASAAATAMARYIEDRVVTDTLQQTTHAPGAYHRARPGAPPATASGSLAKGMYHTPASGELRASAYVGNDARHARMLEFGGCVLKPRGGKTMKWKDTGRETHWHHARLPANQDEFPAHPFIGPTTDEAIDDGELRRIAIDAFREYDP